MCAGNGMGVGVAMFFLLKTSGSLCIESLLTANILLKATTYLVKCIDFEGFEAIFLHIDIFCMLVNKS